MDDTSLDLSLGLNCADGFLKTGQPVDTKEQNIL